MAAKRDKKGRFIKGVSGNPKGRSTKDREERYYQIAMSSVTYDDWVKIIKTAVKQAQRGDQQARKWLSEYLAPQTANHNVEANVDLIRVDIVDLLEDND